jgi:putative endopeptidase
MIPVMMLAACQPKETKAPALDPTDMDLTVAPGADFFQYANGGWMAKNPLKPEYARFGSFDVLREKNVEDLNALFSEMTNMNPEPGSIDQKIVDLYKQGLDSTRLNEEGAAPIKKYLDELYAVADKKALAAHLGQLNLVGEGGFFGGGVDADLMDSKTQVFYLGQGGLGMGDRDYYVDAANAELRKGYEAMLAKLFALAGLDNAEQRAANAAGVEDKLAQFSWTSSTSRITWSRHRRTAAVVWV